MVPESKLVRLVMSAARRSNGRSTLPCVEAFRLARTHKIGLRRIGRICNEHNIGIVRCQLGCFP